MHALSHTHSLSSLVELSSSGFEARELSWADIPFLTYVLSSGYFMTATGKEGKDNRPIEEEFLVVLWLSPMIRTCAHFFTQMEVYTHYRAPPHLQGSTSCKEAGTTWTYNMGLKHSANAVYEFAASRHSVFITQRPWGSRTGQDRRTGQTGHDSYP